MRLEKAMEAPQKCILRTFMDMYGLINGRKTGRILRKHALYALRGILLCFWNEEEYFFLKDCKI